MNSGKLTVRPEESVYQSCYTPVSLGDMLADGMARGKIRRIPVAQLFFGISELSEPELAALMPQITEEQWSGILDLSIWRRDRTSSIEFLSRSRHLLVADEPVARKLLRGSDPELWQLAFNRLLEVIPRHEQGAGPDLPEGDWITTPDDGFWIRLPDDPEASRLIRPLLLKLYELDPDQATQLILLSKARTASELEETAYQKRQRRMEDLGFQDYFDSISVFSPLTLEDSFPNKAWLRSPESVAIAPLNKTLAGLFFFKTLARLDERSRQEEILEELFYVSNKVLSADLVSPDLPSRVKTGIRKTILGINIGLELAAGRDVHQAARLLETRYLQSFFQLSYGLLLELQVLARQLQQDVGSSLDSYPDQLVRGLLRRYPLLAVRTPTRIKKRFFQTLTDTERCRGILGHLRSAVGEKRG